MAEPDDRSEQLRHLQGGIASPCPTCGTALFDRNRDPQEHEPGSAECVRNREWVDRHEREQSTAHSAERPPWLQPW